MRLINARHSQKKFRKAAGGVKKMENRDAVEATVWGAYSIAYSDGTCDAKEIAVLEKTIAALPAFAPFSGEIAQMCANIRAQYEASPRRANAQALRELADVSGTNDAVDVLCLCIDIADQDGIGAEEQEQLKKIAQALQLPLEQYI
ncbi:tellurite resistance TerB family protein (plasmid) [Escherichia coli]